MSFAAAAALSGIADIGNAMLSQYYNKKNMRDQANLQYSFAERYARNSPSWNVQGLRDAGLNPILSVSNGVNLGANIPNITNSSPKADIDIPAVEALKASKEVDIQRQNSESQIDVNETQSGLNQANVDLTKANTAVKLLEAERIKQDIKGGGYKNPIVNDVVRGMNNTAEALKNSPTTDDSFSSYIKSAPDSPNYSKDSFFGGIQASIEADKEVSRLTGKSAYQVSKMTNTEKIKILENAKKQKVKSRGYHIFTR